MQSTTKFHNLFISLCLMAIVLISCNTNKAKSTTEQVEEAIEYVVPAGEIHAFYFHATRRCATCEAVEKVTTSFLKANYADKVTFTSINRDDDKNAAMLKAYKISGQTLLIVKDDQLINLTNEAFLNARNKPEKLEAKIKETIDALL